MALTQVSTGGIKDGQVQTADLADGQVTVGKLHADALDRTYTLGASGTNHYTFTGEGLTGAVNDPTLYLTRGKTYRFVNGNSAGAHPFRIQTTVNGSAGTEYNTGVTNNGGAGGSTIVFEVPHDAPDVLYYQCTSHGSMGGIFYITGALADSGVTTAKLADNAVTTNKIATNAVTTTKLAADAIINSLIADNAVETANIANSQVTTAKIADDAVTNAKIAASAVGSTEIADNAVGTSKVADNSITHAKYQDIPTSRLLGRTSSGTGNPETLDASTVRTFLNVENGATAGGGKIIQVVSTTRAAGSTFSTSSGSPQDFMSLNITTTANNSKVLVISNSFVRTRRYPGTETYARVRLVRGSTSLAADRQFGHEAYPNTSINAVNASFTHVHLDTPGNAGTYTYKIQMINDSGGNATAYGYDDSTITLLEVAG